MLFIAPSVWRTLPISKKMPFDSMNRFTPNSASLRANQLSALESCPRPEQQMSLKTPGRTGRQQWGSLSYCPRATRRFWDTCLRPHQRAAAGRGGNVHTTERAKPICRTTAQFKNTACAPRKKEGLCLQKREVHIVLEVNDSQGWVKNEEIQEQIFMLFAPPILSQKLREGARTQTPLHTLYWYCPSFSKLSQEGRTTPLKWLARRGIMFLHRVKHITSQLPINTHQEH